MTLLLTFNVFVLIGLSVAALWGYRTSNPPSTTLRHTLHRIPLVLRARPGALFLASVSYLVGGALLMLNSGIGVARGELASLLGTAFETAAYAAPAGVATHFFLHAIDKASRADHQRRPNTLGLIVWYYLWLMMHHVASFATTFLMPTPHPQALLYALTTSLGALGFYFLTSWVDQALILDGLSLPDALRASVRRTASRPLVYPTVFFLPTLLWLLAIKGLRPPSEALLPVYFVVMALGFCFRGLFWTMEWLEPQLRAIDSPAAAEEDPIPAPDTVWSPPRHSDDV